MALQGKPATPFRVPKGIELIPINVKSGQRDLFGDDGVILEAFKPGEEPPSRTKVIGDQVATSGAPMPGGTQAPPESEAVIEGGLTTGTGGLY
jgi:penicillin-binding protein 1A